MKRIIVTLVAGILLALSITATDAQASIPASDGTIYGCYNNLTGRLSVINGPSQSCLGPIETPLNWSQTGPQGPAGPQGATGATGPQGPAGAPGTGSAMWVSASQHFTTAPDLSSDGTPTSVTVNCPTGYVVVFAETGPVIMDNPTYNTGYSFGIDNIYTPVPAGETSPDPRRLGQNSVSASELSAQFYNGNTFIPSVGYSMSLWALCVPVSNPNDGPPPVP